MIIEEIRKELFNNQDEVYRDFQIKLIPTVSSDSIIGVRTPVLKKYAKELVNKDDIDSFLNDLPHKYFDENQLHAFIISNIKDFDKCINEINKFLPYIDNWATCDQLSPNIFKKHHNKLLEWIKIWIKSNHTYTVRFSLGMILSHFLDEDFDKEYLKIAASIKTDEYYINMMIAWLFATSLAKKYEETIPFIEGGYLSSDVLNKTIQKAVESYRIKDEDKIYLRSLKVKK